MALCTKATKSEETCTFLSEKVYGDRGYVTSSGPKWMLNQCILCAFDSPRHKRHGDIMWGL
jgi:hypothetical protein